MQGFKGELSARKVRNAENLEDVEGVSVPHLTLSQSGLENSHKQQTHNVPCNQVYKKSIILMCTVLSRAV